VAKSASNHRSDVYDSAVDWWILALLLLTPVAAAVIGIYLIVQGRPGDSTWLFLTGGLTAITTAAFAVPCRYTILDDALSIRCGLLFYQIPLDKITDVSLSSSWMSGPALSLKRVKVQTDRRSHIISPKFREDFVRDLRKAIKHST
jgi:membrane protein YdbS with pleckstrin-like domain